MTERNKLSILAGEPKYTHKEADYGRGLPQAHCSICKHYRGVNDCELVEAPIAPAMWCKFFRRRAQTHKSD